jgi:hypothetical protein
MMQMLMDQQQQQQLRQGSALLQRGPLRPAAPFRAEMRKNVDVLRNEEGEKRIVVAGTGLVAAQDCHKGGFLLDSAAVHYEDTPPIFDKNDGYGYRIIVIAGQVGYFQLRSFRNSENTPWASTSFYMNEARARDGTKANIKWRSHHLHEKGQAPVFRWEFLRDVTKGEELLAQYVS